jgi:hypothetical protein
VENNGTKGDTDWAVGASHGDRILQARTSQGAGGQAQVLRDSLTECFSKGRDLLGQLLGGASVAASKTIIAVDKQVKMEKPKSGL